MSFESENENLTPQEDTPNISDSESTEVSSSDHQGPDLDLEPPKKKAPVGIIVAVIAVVAVIVGVFAFGGNKGGTSGLGDADPDVYLQAAFEATSKNMEQEGEFNIDLNRFEGKPIAADFVMNMDGSSIGIPGKVTLDLLAKVDHEQKRALIEGGFAASMISFPDNKFYVSSDLIAISIPALFSTFDYVTIIPETFVEDYRNSLFYSGYDDFSEDFNLKETLDELFSGEFGEEMEEDVFVTHMTDAWENFLANGITTNEGATTLSIGGQDMKLDTISQTYEAETVQALYRSFADAYGDQMQRQMALGAMGGISQYELQTIMESFDAMSFNDPITVRYFIDEKGLIRKVQVDRFKIHFQDPYYDMDEDLRVDFEITFAGETNVAHNIDMRLLILDDLNEEVELALTFDREDIGGTLTHHGKLLMRYEDEDPIIFAYDLEWAPESADKNLRLGIEIQADQEIGGMLITGLLKDDPDKFSLTDGKMDFYMSDEDLFSLNFDFSYYNIDASEVELPEGEQLKFSELSYQHLMGMGA